MLLLGGTVELFGVLEDGKQGVGLPRYIQVVECLFPKAGVGRKVDRGMRYATAKGSPGVVLSWS